MIILVIAVMAIYARLGYKLNKNSWVWALIGFGIYLTFPVICSPMLFLNFGPATKLLYWTLVNVCNPVFAVLVAGFIAYKKGLLFTKAPVL